MFPTWPTELEVRISCGLQRSLWKMLSCPTWPLCPWSWCILGLEVVNRKAIYKLQLWEAQAGLSRTVFPAERQIRLSKIIDMKITSRKTLGSPAPSNLLSLKEFLNSGKTGSQGPTGLPNFFLHHMDTNSASPRRDPRIFFSRPALLLWLCWSNSSKVLIYSN